MLTKISVVVLGICCVANTSYAGGFATARFGSEHGHAAADHPTTMYYNPAGLSLGVGTRLYVEGLFALRLASYDRPEGAIDSVGSGTPNDAVAINAGDAKLTNFLVSPFLGIATDFGVPNLGVGVGIYAPFGGQATWGQNDQFADNQQYPGAVDGVQRWAVIEGQQRAVYGTVAGAYRLPGPRLSFGVGVNLVMLQTDTIRARNIAGTDDMVAGDILVEGRSIVDVSATTFSVSGGVIWQPIDALHVGLSYQSQPGFGEVGMEGTLTNKFGAGTTGETALDLTQSLPDIVRFAARYRMSPQLELRLSGDYQHWSVFDKHCLMELDDEDRNCDIADDGSSGPNSSGIILNIPRDYQDTFGVRVGGSYWLDPHTELNGGFAYDSNAVPDETIDPSLFDMDKFVISAGGRVGFLEGALALTVNFSQVIYLKREVDPRARDTDGAVIAPSAPSRNPDMAGTYTQAISLLTMGVEYLF